MAYGTVNADVIGTSVTGSNLGAGNASIMKNRIINGAMVIDQRNAGASVTATTSAPYSVDRFFVYSSPTSKFTAQQNAGSVTPPVGFVNYLGCTSSSAYTVSGTDITAIAQRIEGNNLADLGWGTANAKTVTLSFQVYSSLTGTFGGSVQNGNADRSYPFTYTISAANTWTSISVTIAGDTTGTWSATTGTGMQLWFGLGVGATRSGTANTWAGANYVSATGATSVVGTNGATFYITGVQLEVGSSATGFEYVNYQTSLANCQRYFQKSWNQTTKVGTLATGNDIDPNYVQQDWMVAATLSIATGNANYPVIVRSSSPTVTIYDTVGNTNKVTTLDGSGNGTTNRDINLLLISDSRLAVRIYNISGAVGMVFAYTVSAEL
jgi:hypothetical protein